MRIEEDCGKTGQKSYQHLGKIDERIFEYFLNICVLKYG